MVVEHEKLELLESMKREYKTLHRRRKEVQSKIDTINNSIKDLEKQGDSLTRSMGWDDPLAFIAYVNDVCSLPEKFTEGAKG